MLSKKFVSLLLLILSLLSFSSSAIAISEEEQSFLSMYFSEEELQVISSTRSLQSISRVAENMTVITAEDIELMNAHTLNDVLNSVNGVQIYIGGASPGSASSPIIQSSEFYHVALFIDGVSINYLSSNAPLSDFVPVQMIKRIELIKGPASSSWGSSLGGVINIITKSPEDTGRIGGTVSASYGERNTGDFRAEVFGKKDRFGLYFYTGRLQTNGFRPSEELSDNHFYTKLSFDISKETSIFFSLFYFKADRGRGESVPGDWRDNDKTEGLFSTLSLKSALSKELELNLSVKASQLFSDFYDEILSGGGFYFKNDSLERKIGTSANLIWKHKPNTFVLGTDYDHSYLGSNTIIDEKKRMDKWAVFLNDTISLNKFTLIPGLRYDHSNTYGDFFSPSLGATYELLQKVLLRAYIAKGFNNPSFDNSFTSSSWYTPNPKLKPERVWSYQLGIEADLLKYVLLKVSGFRHEIRDALASEDSDNDGVFTMVNKNRLRRQGIELAFRTLPVYHFTLSGSASFIHVKDLDEDKVKKGYPTSTYDIAIKYDDEKSFRALLQGHYIWWNEDTGYSAKYSSMVFDLNMIKSIYRNKDQNLEVFLTGHNIFNASQYWIDLFRNNRRWIEAGVRMKF